MNSSLFSRLAPLLLLSACCTLTQSVSTANSSKLETDHLAFIAKFTASPVPTTAPTLPPDFDAQVAAITKDFDAAASDAGWCGTQKQIFVNEKALFLADVALLQKQHYFSSARAKARTVQIRQNYEQLAPKKP
jgi:hypothetical protein